MNDRIKKIRRELKMTQDDFGKRIGLARNSVANYEIGRRTPTNAVITSICREFGVNEVWLRTGEGGESNMFSKMSKDDRYSISLGKLAASDNKFIQNALITLAETDPDKLKVIEEFMKKCLGLE